MSFLQVDGDGCGDRARRAGARASPATQAAPRHPGLRLTMTVTVHACCAIAQAGWACRHAASLTALMVALPRWMARNPPRAGRWPGYPPAALVRRRAVPVMTAGTCQESMPREESATITDWPADTRTVSPLSATVSVAAAPGADDEPPGGRPVAEPLALGGTLPVRAAVAEPAVAEADGAGPDPAADPAG